MQYIKQSELIIPPSRQRQIFDSEKLTELQDSIHRNGLFHAVVVRNGNTLVAGERRTKAIEALHMLGMDFTYEGKPVPVDTIPVVDLGELSEFQAYEAELEENVVRQDLSWQERAEAIGKLHSLREALAQQTGKIHTIADTAEEVTGQRKGDYHDKIRKAVIVSEHFDNPQIAKAKSVDEAFKILKKEEAQKKAAAVAEVMGTIASSEKLFAYHANCLDWMREYTGEKFDCICTDPPYGMGADDFGDAGARLTSSSHEYDDSPEAFYALMQEFIPLAFEVTKPQAHIYHMCDIDKFQWLKEEYQKAGFYVFRTPIINYKTDGNRVPLPDKGPRRQYEVILYAIKGGKLVTGIYSDVIPTKSDANTPHGAQKPVEIYVNLLKRSVTAGELVADFFAGSGPILSAADALSLRAVAVEQNASAYGYCVQRLKLISGE